MVLCVVSTGNKASGVTSIVLLFEPADAATGLATLDGLKGMCEITAKVRAILGATYDDYCSFWAGADGVAEFGGTCCTDRSIGDWFARWADNAGGCAALTQADVDAGMAVLKACAAHFDGYSGTKKLTRMCADHVNYDFADVLQNRGDGDEEVPVDETCLITEGSDPTLHADARNCFVGTRSENPVWDILGSLAENTWLDGVDHDTPDADVSPLRIARVLLPFSRDFNNDDEDALTAELKEVWTDVRELIGEPVGGAQLRSMQLGGVFGDLMQDTLIKDMILAVGSVVCVLFVLFLHTTSFKLAFVA